MNTDAKDFIEIWVDENVAPEGFIERDDMSPAVVLAELCRAEAKKLGITTEELDIAASKMPLSGDNLVELMANAMNNVTRVWIQR
jgi:hypothetical protein